MRHRSDVLKALASRAKAGIVGCMHMLVGSLLHNQEYITRSVQRTQ